MNLVKKVEQLVTSTTLTIHSFKQPSHLSSSIMHSLYEGMSVIGKILAKSKKFEGHDLFYIETEDGALYELAALTNGYEWVLSYIDHKRWKPIDYYADDDEFDEKPLYHSNIINELKYFNVALDEKVIENDHNFWIPKDDQPLSKYHAKSHPKKIQIHIK